MATQAASAAAPAAAGLSTKQTIIAAAVVTVIAGAMGAMFALPLPTKPASAKSETAAAEAATHMPAGAGYFDLPPIVTNLADSSDTWIRLEASMVYDARAIPHPEVLAGLIATDELAYLRTATLAQMEGPIGLQNIRQDLTERAAIRSGGKVTELIIRTLVVQ